MLNKVEGHICKLILVTICVIENSFIIAKLILFIKNNFLYYLYKPILLILFNLFRYNDVKVLNLAN